MKELEIDEDMFEEDKINRFLNMIATQYDGNLATQYASSYLKKCNELDKYKKVIDKIKEYMKKNANEPVYLDMKLYEAEVYKDILELLEEINGD